MRWGDDMRRETRRRWRDRGVWTTVLRHRRHLLALQLPLQISLVLVLMVVLVLVVLTVSFAAKKVHCNLFKASLLWAARLYGLDGRQWMKWRHGEMLSNDDWTDVSKEAEREREDVVVWVWAALAADAHCCYDCRINTAPVDVLSLNRRRLFTTKQTQCSRGSTNSGKERKIGEKALGEAGRNGSRGCGFLDRSERQCTGTDWVVAGASIILSVASCNEWQWECFKMQTNKWRAETVGWRSPERERTRGWGGGREEAM